jgi:glycine/D-amino acid oxidase-like deaminating enzyme
MPSSEDRKIVIIGGGIIGCTTAYYISRHPSFSISSSTIIIVEASAHGVAQGASGKAGGLVAKWADPIELADISFKEHAELAKEHNGKDRWGWRLVGCGDWEGRGEPANGKDSNPGGGANKPSEKTLKVNIKKSQAKKLINRTGMRKAYRTICSG